ncbi:MAG: hypothetical protein KGL39_35340, partial [Patescibacteria group bacterium]|nr:hypothetical protein [Patescibacteria group bacterium]
RLISAKCGNVRFLDSFNHFRMPLKQIGECIGVKKLDFDISSPEYVSTDAWICLTVMTRARDYIASLGGKIGATAGSSALSVWRYMTDDEYMTGPIDSPWLRRGYYGGRTEIFRPMTECKWVRSAGKVNVKVHRPDEVMLINRERVPVDPEDGTGWLGWDEEVLRASERKNLLSICREHGIHGYDINSMYPFCMMNEYPESLIDDPDMTKGKGMAEVTISLPTDIYFAPLPYRTANDELWYPVGVFRGVWTYDEVRRAEEMGGRVLKVHKAYGCNVMCRPFNQFVTTLYQRRKSSKDESERLFLKVLMNSIYGKVASRNQVTRTVSRFQLMKDKAKAKRLDEVKWITYHRGLLDYFTPQQPYVNVCWGAMVTAYARLLLHKYLMAVPPEKAIYCDTDSVYCVDHQLATGPELGQMKLERTAGVMAVVQPKAYRLDDYYRAKGVPRPKYDDNGKVVIDFARQYVEDGYTEFQAPIRFRRSINSKQGKANQWIKMSKGRKSAYSAKILSGDRYFPPVIGEQLQLTLPVTKRGAKQTQLIK